jgi:hypothetical protein
LRKLWLIWCERLQYEDPEPFSIFDTGNKISAKAHLLADEFYLEAVVDVADPFMVLIRPWRISDEIAVKALFATIGTRRCADVSSCVAD